MSRPANKRKQIFANKLHSQAVFLVFLAGALPAVITTICLYYLIFQIMAETVVMATNTRGMLINQFGVFLLTR